MLTRIKRRNPTLIGVVVLLTACQTSPGSPHTSLPAAASAEASSARATPDTTTHPAPPTQPTDIGQPTPITERKVLVTASATDYPSAAMISVVVANGLDHTIFTEDSKSDCSLVVLQELRNSSWHDLTGCAQQRPPATFGIGPARSRTINLHPASDNFRAANPARTPLKAGTYRVTFSYRMTEEPDNTNDTTVASTPFRIT